MIAVSYTAGVCSRGLVALVALAIGLEQDYKPLYYDRGRDSHGVPQMTIGASFGATRELTLMHVKSGVTMRRPLYDLTYGHTNIARCEDLARIFVICIQQRTLCAHNTQ